MFDTTAVVGSGSKQQDQAARMILADGKVTVLPAGASKQALHAVPYASVVSISYSKGRDPLWVSPKGPVPVRRSSGGFWKFLGIATEHHWICLETRVDGKGPARFVVLQFSDESVRPALTALEERTGKDAHVLVDG
jgi:hypothetical protein